MAIEMILAVTSVVGMLYALVGVYITPAMPCEFSYSRTVP